MNNNIQDKAEVDANEVINELTITIAVQAREIAVLKTQLKAQPKATAE